MVLLDIMLPDEDGLSILKKLRATPETRRIPVILVTAKTTEIDKVKGLDSGADDHSITFPRSHRQQWVTAWKMAQFLTGWHFVY